MTYPVVPAWEVQARAGKAPATVRVRDLQVTLTGPSDAWGRLGKPQPLLITAEVSLAKPFGSSSQEDAVASDTVHYGLLSKAILKGLKRFEAEANSGNSSRSLRGVLNTLWQDLTGCDAAGHSFSDAEPGFKPFLNLEAVRKFKLTLKLPKASLLGGGVSLTCEELYEAGERRLQAKTLRIHELRVPTLIGVNDNERMAKQVVVANVEVDKFDDGHDAYSKLEATIVEAMSSSSFETLEALGASMASDIARHLKESCGKPDGGWDVTIGLEKPIAVPLADAACVEMCFNTDDGASS